MKTSITFPVLLLALALLVAMAHTKTLVSQRTADGAELIIQSAIAQKNQVFDRLAFVCDTFGPRFSGSEALDKAIDWIYNTIKNQDRLQVQLEPVMIPKWVRGREYARMVAPGVRQKELGMVGLGMSIGTPNKTSIVADVFVVKSFDDLKAKADQVKGKIVVFNVPFTTYGETVQYRVFGAKMAAKYGAVAALVRSVTPFSIYEPHAGVSETAEVPSAAITIEDTLLMQRMQDRGQRVVVELYMEAHMEPDVLSHNIVIDLPGTEKPDEFVIFGGHLDSWDVAEGAMDDGGGAFVSWEVIRLINSLGLQSKRTIRVVLFVNEENGSRGAAQYAKDHAKEFERVSIAIESDAGTFSPYGLSITASNETVAILASIGEQLLSGIGSGNVTLGGSGEDISPMCSAGVPCASLQVRDPRFDNHANNPCRAYIGDNSNHPVSKEGIPDGYFWYHHTTADTPDKLDPDQLQHNVATMGAWIYAIANLDDLLPR